MKKIVISDDPNAPCPYKKCTHLNGKHINGSCYEVTEPEKLGTEIYCKCDSSEHGQNLRLYRDVGVMYPQTNDMMISTKCMNCRKPCMLRIDETLCSVCRPYEQPVLTEISEHIIFRPVSQMELQRQI